MKNKLTIVPSLKGYDDAQAVKMLANLSDAGQQATKVIFDAGLYCFWLKDNLGHGNFGRWLQAHAHERFWRLDSNGNPKASTVLSWQMGFTKGLIETCKMTVESVLLKFPTGGEFPATGKFLALSNGVPQPLQTLHSACIKRVEGQTAFQMFLEFKQADADGNKKRGRLKGQGGASAAQRAAHQAALEAGSIKALELWAEETIERIQEAADDKRLGMIDDRLALKLGEAFRTGYGYLSHLFERRKAGKEGTK